MRMKPTSNESTYSADARPAQRVIKLSDADRDQLLDLLDSPPGPSQDLRELMRIKKTGQG